MPIRSITPVDIDDFYLAVTKDLQYTKKAVSNARGILNGIMNYYVKRGIIPQNPARDISLRCSKPIRKKMRETLILQRFSHLKSCRRPESKRNSGLQT